MVRLFETKDGHAKVYAVTGVKFTEAIKTVLKRNKVSYAKQGEWESIRGRIVRNGNNDELWKFKDTAKGEECFIVYKKKYKKEIFG